MGNRIDKIYVTTGREMIEKERKRLLKLKEENKTWWESENSNWAREMFGENLIEKDGTTWPSGNKFDEHRCNICGRIPKFDEKIVRLDFSFCEEYGCHMNICQDCVKNFFNILKSKNGISYRP